MAAEGQSPGLVDVVIATRNRPEALRRCLTALDRQTLAGFGVVVVDDGSEPSIGPVVTEFPGLAATVVRNDPSVGPAAARNRGVEHVEARYVAFVDDDMVVEPDFLERHVAAVTAEGEDVPIVSCGPFVEPPDWDPTPWNDWEAHQLRKSSTALVTEQYPVTWRQFHTGNNCLPTARFRELGGFDETFLRGEDDELAYRLDRSGCRFVFVPEAIGWHYAVRSLDAWLSIPRSYARFEHRFDQLHPEADHLATKKEELSRRSVVLRAARRLAGGPRRTAVAVKAAVSAARVLHRVGLRWPAFGLLSVAYDLNYVDGLREVERAEAAP